MNRLLAYTLGRGLRHGSLRVTYADGQVRTYGEGNGPEVAIRFADEQAEWAFALDPALKLGELYVDGRIVLEQGDCYDFIETMKRNARRVATPPVIAYHALRHLSAYARTQQSLATARRNIAHHYDLDERFYRLFLDADMQYSCAYFEHAGQSLEQAQLAKKRHIAAKLLLDPGHTVLDIGSGWGGLGLYLAEVAGANVTGVTISAPQHDVSTRRAAERGLDDRARFLMADYRTMSGPFDRIVSVGMFEQIGRAAYDGFFRKAAQLLSPNGVMVLHSIGRTRPHRAYNPWIERYIFPGSYIPALSEVLPAIERAGFLVTDVETLRLHYAETLRAWRARFRARRDEVLAIYDERFFRMWEFYLAGSEAGFRVDRMFVFQIQLTRPQHVVPTCRDYLLTAEAALAKAEAQFEAYRVDDAS